MLEQVQARAADPEQTVKRMKHELGEAKESAKSCNICMASGGKSDMFKRAPGNILERADLTGPGLLTLVLTLTTVIEMDGSGDQRRKGGMLAVVQLEAFAV